MDKMKNSSKEEMVCIFCRRPLDNNNSSIEHIIPKSIIKIDSMVINSVCKECNYLIGKKVEQPAIKYLLREVARIVISNQSIKSGRRRKKRNM